MTDPGFTRWWGSAQPPRVWPRALGAALAPMPVVLVLVPLRGTVNNTAVALLLVLVVVAASSTGTRWAGILTAVSSGVWFDLFSTTPYGQLRIDNRADITTAVLLVLIGAAVSELAGWGHRQQALSDCRAGYLQGVLETAQIVALRERSCAELVTHVTRQIKEVLEVTHCHFVLGTVVDARIPLLAHDGTVARNGHVVDVERDGLPTDFETALVVTLHGVHVGSFRVISPARLTRPSREQRLVAVLLADQVSAAFCA